MQNGTEIYIHTVKTDPSKKSKPNEKDASASNLEARLWSVLSSSPAFCPQALHSGSHTDGIFKSTLLNYDSHIIKCKFSKAFPKNSQACDLASWKPSDGNVPN